MFDERGYLDRAKLGAQIFSDPAKRKILNSITHPPIFKQIVGFYFELPNHATSLSPDFPDFVVLLAGTQMHCAGPAPLV